MASKWITVPHGPHGREWIDLSKIVRVKECQKTVQGVHCGFGAQDYLELVFADGHKTVVVGETREAVLAYLHEQALSTKAG